MHRFKRLFSRQPAIPRHFQHRSPLFVEQLETRTFLSGVTLITHGFQRETGMPDWLLNMSDAVAARAGGASQYILKLSTTENTISRRSGPMINAANNASGEIILLVDWSDWSNSISHPLTYTDWIADQILPTLESTYPTIGINQPLIEQPIHLIGHSRGGTLVSSLAEKLGSVGVWIDHLTTLDPQPVLLDPQPTMPDNVVFADNYYQTSDLFFGNNVPNSYQVNLTNLSEGNQSLTTGFGLITVSNGDHADVHTWYHGTVPISGNLSDGIISPIPQSWYSNNSQGPRNSTGFFFSRIARGSRPNSYIYNPNDGLSVSTNGWDNVIFNNLKTDLSIQSGGMIPISTYVGDLNRNATLTFGFDTDSNPYNGEGSDKVTSKSWSTASISNSYPTTVTYSMSTGNITPGKYHIYAKISNGTQTRYDYSLGEITVTPPPTLTIGDLSVNESNGNANVIVTMSEASVADVTVQYVTGAITALANQDYTVTSGTLTIPAGQTTGTIVIPITNDTLPELAETFSVNLSSPSNATIARTRAIVTIPSNDLPSLSVADLQVNESAGHADAIVTLSQAVTFTVTVQYSTTNGTATAGQDYSTTSGLLTFAPGQTIGKIVVPITDDNSPELAEAFNVNLSSPTNANVSDALALVTIQPNDLPTISVSNTEFLESVGKARIFFDLSQAVPFPVTIHVATVSGTATSPADYTPMVDDRTIPVNLKRAYFEIPIIDNSTITGPRSFSISFSNAVNGILKSNSASVTIIDDEVSVIPFSKGNPAPYHDNNLRGFSVVLTGPGDGEVWIPTDTSLKPWIRLQNSTDLTSLTISPIGISSTTTLRSINITGSLNKLTAGAVTITNELSVSSTAKSITLAGISGELNVGPAIDAAKDKTKLTLGVVAELELNSQTPIDSLKLLDWQDNDATDDVITAPWINTLTVSGRKAKTGVTALAGNFEADLQLSGTGDVKKKSLTTATIAGAIHESEWHITGNVGNVTAASMNSALIFLGIGLSPVAMSTSLGSLKLKPAKGSIAPTFVASTLFVRSVLTSLDLGLVDTTQQVPDPDPNQIRELSIQATVIKSAKLRIAGFNNDKVVTLKNILVPADFNVPKNNPANLPAVTDLFKVIVLD